MKTFEEYIENFKDRNIRQELQKGFNKVIKQAVDKKRTLFFGTKMLLAPDFLIQPFASVPGPYPQNKIRSGLKLFITKDRVNHEVLKKYNYQFQQHEDTSGVIYDNMKNQIQVSHVLEMLAAFLEIDDLGTWDF